MTHDSLEPTATLELQLPSTHESLTAMMDQLEQFANAEEFSEEVAYRLMLVTSEAVTNAIRHGNRLDPKKMVTLHVRAFRASIEICVEDEGAGFERGRLTDPRSEDNLLREGGRGVFLIEELADDVRYEKGGSRIRIRVRRNQS